MSSSEEMYEIVLFCFSSLTWVTGLVIAFGLIKSVHAFIKAYTDNKTYDAMKKNKDKTGLTQFYYGIVISASCVIVFFLPYFFYFER